MTISRREALRIARPREPYTVYVLILIDELSDFVQDLLTYGITINTYFIDRPGHRFNPTLYWNVRSTALNADIRIF